MSHTLVEKSAALRSEGGNEHTTHALDRIQDALRGLRYGTVSVIVQDGIVVQVERTERLRLVRR